MCLRCDGWSEDEVNALVDERIRTYGWTTTGVGDGPGRPTWTYTVGLALADHPDLVVATVAFERAVEVLGDLAHRVVADGECFDTVDQATCVDGLTVGLRDVHPVHVERGLVGAGQGYYAWLGRPMPALPIRQVVLPDSEFCRCHAGSQPQLHLGHVLFGGAGPNRAERRRTSRRRRRTGG
jgi:hypothetical protein